MRCPFCVESVAFGNSLTYTTLADLLNARDIEYVRFADLTTAEDVNINRMIAVPDVGIVIDVFDLLGDKGSEPSSQPVRLSAADAGSDGAPQTKILNLPSRDLNRIWDS